MLHLRVSMTRGSAIPGPRPGAFGWDAGIGSRLDGNDVAHSGPPAQSTREEISWLDSVWEKRLSRNVPRPMMRTARRGGLSTGRVLCDREIPCSQPFNRIRRQYPWLGRLVRMTALSRQTDREWPL